MRPVIPRSVQIAIRQYVVELQLKRNSNLWPIDLAAGKKPDDWPGWPEGKKFALILTHDVDTAAGQDNCINLKNLEEGLGFKSSFNFVPERYPVSSEVLNCLRDSGFEIGVHGLNHDGKLFNSRDIFKERSERINHYLSEWGAVGFRAPAMHHNLEWLHDLEIKYDASTFDTDPFEPQPDGQGTIFPFWVSSNTKDSGYVELPYTLAQDFTLFVLLKEGNIEIWKKKLDWIVEHGGMALLNVHPDYMAFNGDKLGLENYPAEYYANFLEYVRETYGDVMWEALPCQVASYCRSYAFDS